MPPSTTSSVVQVLGFSKLLLPVLLLLLATPASAHFSVTYPPWRGDSFPTQWTYPCGDVNSTATTNRTAWPIEGGAVAFMPTHPWAQTYINLGLGNNVTRFNITLMEPFNQTSNGTICLPHVTLPDDMMASVKEGDLASIQIIQLSHTGGALYNCADIEFSSNASEPSQEVCFNSTGVGAQPLDYAGTATCDAANTTDDAQTSSPSGSASLAVGYTWLVTMAMGVVVAGLMV